MLINCRIPDRLIWLMQPKHHKQAEGERIDQYIENDGSFSHYSDLNQFQNVKHPYAGSSCQVFPDPAIQKQNSGTDPVRYLQTNIPYMDLDYSHLSDQISVCPTESDTQIEKNGHPSSLVKESSYASSQVLSLENSCGPFNAPAVIKKQKQLLCGDIDPPFSKCRENPETFCVPVSVQKHAEQPENETEVHSDVEGVSIGMQPEFYSSNLQESSCMSSVLDEISLEATSFRQLKQVTEQV